jgi:ATP-binding cassette subfamily B protein
MNRDIDSNIDNQILPLAFDFSLHESEEISSNIKIRALSKVLRIQGHGNQDLKNIKTNENESLKNFLDNNSIVYRETNLSRYNYKNTIPTTIACTIDDYICIYSEGRTQKFYSANKNTNISLREVEALSLKQSYEIFGGLKDNPLNFVDVINFTFNKQLSLFITVLLVALLTTILYVTLPLFTSALIEDIIPYANISLLTYYSLGFMLVLGVSSLTVYVQNILLIRLETITDLRIQVALWDRLIKLPLSKINIFNAGDLNSRVDAVSRIRNILTSAVLQTILGSIFSIIYLVLMIICAPVATLVTMPILIILVIILAYLVYQKFRLQLVVFQQEADTLNFSFQSVLNLVPFKSAGLEKRLLLKWLTEIHKLAVLNLKAQSFEDAASYIVQFARTTSLAVVFFYVYFRLNLYPTQILDDKLLQITGSYVTFLVAFQGLFSGISRLVLILGSSVSEVYVQWQRAHSIFASPIDPGYSEKSISHSIKNNIVLKDISYQYSLGFTQIFTKLNIKFDVGKFTAIKGPSGCGKTTLLRLILGLEKPDSGIILIDNIDINKINIRQYRRDIGVVMQDITMFPASIYKNICAGLDFSEDEVWNALERAEIADEVNNMPMKLNTVLANGGASMSGGQLQRLCIARALIGNPSILLLDEATSALDPQQQKNLLDSLMHEGVSLISIAHRLSTIKNADAVYTIKNGGAELNA